MDVHNNCDATIITNNNQTVSDWVLTVNDHRHKNDFDEPGKKFRKIRAAANNVMPLEMLNASNTNALEN